MSIALEFLYGVQFGIEWIPIDQDIVDTEATSMLVINLFIARLSVAFYDE